MGRERLLLDRYLDRLASPGETDELGQLLAARPDLADELVRATRIETLLESHCREQAARAAALSLAVPRESPAPAGPRRRRAWSWAAAAALLLALGAVGGALAYRHANRPERGPQPSVVVAGQLLVDGAPADRAEDGSRLEVAGDAAAVLRLPDGSRAELAPGSVAVTHGPGGGVRRAVGLDRGRATFYVERGPEGFRVDTPLGSVTALAADFSVELQPVEEEERMSGRGELLLVVAALVGQVEIDSLGRRHVLTSGQSVAFASEGPALPAKPAFAGMTVAVAADGKALTLEGPPDKKNGTAVRRDFKLTPRTEIVYSGVPKDAQRPTVGYHATVWLAEGSADVVARVRLVVKEAVLTGVVAAVSADGKTVTLDLGPGKPGAPTQVEIKIVGGTKLVYREVEKGERPTVGYFAQVWLQPGSKDTAAGITFSGKKPAKPTKPTAGTKPTKDDAKKPGSPDKAGTKPTKDEAEKPGGPDKPAAPAKAVPVRPARDAGPVTALIDAEVDRLLVAARVPASPLADDAEFLRRVTLDLTGRVPTYQRTVAFLEDRSPDKRRRLIEELLASPAYGQHFATLWRELLAPAPVASTKPTRDTFSPWLAEQFNAGRGWNAIVTDLLTAEGPIARSPQSAFLMAHSENFQPQPNLVAAAAARLFLGTQLRCAECHNHPFTSWTQADFWGTAAFFGRLRFTGFKGGGVPSLVETPGPGASLAIPASAGRRGGQKTVNARFLGGAEPRFAAADLLRPRFAAWVTAADNPFFARAAVNRAWGHFFGRGLVNPVDDLDAEPPSHPDLLTRLAREYAASGFDHKHLARAICNSKAYQRSSRPVPGNEADATLFSHMALKPLSPEALYDALAVVFSIDKNDPGPRKPAARGKAGAAPAPSREEFARLFRSQGAPQRLQLMNGPLLNRGAPVVDQLVDTGAGRAEAIATLYLTALSRRPTADEVKLMSGYLARRRDAREGYRGVLWVLLNSSEFALNH
jgi:hypothetical protein